MILSVFRKDATRESAGALYRGLVEQARRPEFYTVHGAPDTVEGRFEMVVLHLYLLLRRLKPEAETRRAAQALTEAFFKNMDDSLREMGVGDLSVGKKVRRMAEDLYGRIAAYEDALAAADEAALAAALARNVMESGEPERAARLVDYVRRAIAALAAQPTARILAGIAEFPDPVASAGPQAARP